MNVTRNESSESVRLHRFLERANALIRSLPVSPGRHIRSCPMKCDWRRWNSATPDRFRLADPDEHNRAASAQQAVRGRRLQTIRARWERAADDAFYQPDPDPHTSYKAGSPCHVHTSFRLGKQRIHIDRLMIERGGPLCVFIEYRIYIDGAVAGRGGICGGPYGNGNMDLPAVAFLDSRRILSVDEDLSIGIWEYLPLPAGTGPEPPIVGQPQSANAR